MGDTLVVPQTRWRDSRVARFQSGRYWAFRSYRNRGDGVRPGNRVHRIHGEVRTSSVVLLPHAPTSVSAARRRLGSDLEAAGVSASVVDDVNVIVSELFSNALRHARPLPGNQVRLAWNRHGDLLEIAVSDGGATTQPRRGPGTLSSLGGRGLGIVEALSENWGVRHEDGGVTTVWAMLRAPRSERAGSGHNGAVTAGSVHAAIPGFVELPEDPGNPDEELHRGSRHGFPQTRAYPG